MRIIPRSFGMPKRLAEYQHAIATAAGTHCSRRGSRVAFFFAHRSSGSCPPSRDLVRLRIVNAVKCARRTSDDFTKFCCPFRARNSPSWA